MCLLLEWEDLSLANAAVRLGGPLGGGGLGWVAML